MDPFAKSANTKIVHKEVSNSSSVENLEGNLNVWVDILLLA